MNKEELLEEIENAKDLSFESIINASGTLFAKVWGQGLLSSLLIVLFSLLVGIICFIPYIVVLVVLGASANYMDFHLSNDERIQIISYIFGGLYSVFAGAIFIAISAAFYRICKMKDHGRIGFNDYYYFLKRKYFSKLIVLSTVSMGIIIPSVAYLSYIPLVYLIVPILFSVTIFAFHHELTIKDIIGIAFKLGTDKWLISLGFILLVGFVCFVVGFIFCGFGFAFTMTFVSIPLYVIYKQIFGFDNENRHEDEDESPVDPYDEKTALIIQKINELNINNRKK